MRRQGRLKRRVAHALRRITRGTAGRRDTVRELYALAWPIAAAMAGETLMGLVDTKLVGGLGAAALGGVGVAMMVVFLGYMIVFGMMLALIFLGILLLSLVLGQLAHRFRLRWSFSTVRLSQY